MPRTRDRRTTTQRGLGADHQRQRAALLPLFVGTPCPCRGCPRHRGPCGTVLTARNMDFDHATPRVLGGARATRFLCRRCNRSRGAALGNRLRAVGRARLVQLVRSDSW